MNSEWKPLEYRRLMPDGSRRHAWTDDGATWSVRVIDARNTLQHEGLNALQSAEEAMTWADKMAGS